MTAFISIPAGTFQMGTNDQDGYPADGEGPVRPVHLDTYSIADTTVTNSDFAQFVNSTNYLTTAESTGTSFVFGGHLPDDFPLTRGVAAAPWWREVPEADWQHPYGPQSSLDGLETHPVVHVSWFDAVAYCEWSNTRLPTEAQWEQAARGGLVGCHFPWGEDREPGGQHLMNVFQGQFPNQDTAEDGWTTTCPVKSFLPNGLGLYEVCGNVWEWCSDWFDARSYSSTEQANPSAEQANPTGPQSGQARVQRGGSYLCHDSYCSRYRVDARNANTPDSTTGHAGFRVVRAS